LRDHGAVFMKTEEVIALPNQTFIDVMCDNTPEYRRFKRDKIISMGDDVLVGDRILKYRMYLKFLANQYNAKKIEALRDILGSSNDRLIVFYNYNAELSQILSSTSREHISIINGKTKDLEAYNRYSDALTCVQYQAGAMGLNLQKANKIIYFSPTESSELFEQSKKRIHRIGQSKPCFYYLLKTRNSIDEDIYKALAERRDYTNELFKESIR
ncbi:MAG: helicase-related protein, partial [Turicibacter sanguinis]